MSSSGSITIPAELVKVFVAELARLVALEALDGCATVGAQPEFMSVETAARYLDVSPERLRKLQARRKIPFYQEDVGCRVLFRRADLDQWMATFRNAPPPTRRHRAPRLSSVERRRPSRTSLDSDQQCGRTSGRALAGRGSER